MKVSATRLLCSLAIPLAVAISLPSASAAEVSRRIQHVEPMFDEPIWLAAEEAVDESGQLDRNLLPRLVAGIERRPTLAPHQCVYFGPLEAEPRSLEDGFRPNRTLTDLTAHSRAIYVGKVVEIENGFYFQRPGTLLQVRLEGTLKRSSTFDPDDHLLIHYPAAEFEAGGYRFCKEDSRYLPRPAVGDRILVFADRPPFDRDRILISPGPNTIFVQPQGKDVAVPSQVKHAVDLQDVRDLAALTNRIESILRDGVPEK